MGRCNEAKNLKKHRATYGQNLYVVESSSSNSEGKC